MISISVQGTGFRLTRYRLSLILDPTVMSQWTMNEYAILVSKPHLAYLRSHLMYGHN
jgi:hypothetical protein